MRKLTNLIRTCSGRKSVPPYYREHISEKGKHLKDVYKYETFTMEIEEKSKESNKQEQCEQKVANRTIVWADSEELLECCLEARKQIGIAKIKVMADGQGSFKICMTMLPENYDPSQDRGLEDYEYEEYLLRQQTENQNSPQRKRTLYSEGGSSAIRGKLTGVHRLIMICCVPQIKESYKNIKLLFDLTNLNKIPFKFVSDYKVILIVNGKQTATSAFPSPYCYISLKALRGNKDDQEDNSDQELDQENEDLQTKEECRTKSEQTH